MILCFADNTETYSYLYKFDTHNQKFSLNQRIKTFGATYIEYFYLVSNQKTEHFLIIANQNKDTFDSDDQFKSSAIIYKFNDEHFIPEQDINFDTAIKHFLPVLVSFIHDFT